MLQNAADSRWRQCNKNEIDKMPTASRLSRLRQKVCTMVRLLILIFALSFPKVALSMSLNGDFQIPVIEFSVTQPTDTVSFSVALFDGHPSETMQRMLEVSQAVTQQADEVVLLTDSARFIRGMAEQNLPPMDLVAISDFTSSPIPKPETRRLSDSVLGQGMLPPEVSGVVVAAVSVSHIAYYFIFTEAPVQGAFLASFVQVVVNYVCMMRSDLVLDALNHISEDPKQLLLRPYRKARKLLRASPEREVSLSETIAAVKVFKENESLLLPRTSTEKEEFWTSIRQSLRRESPKIATVFASLNLFTLAFRSMVYWDSPIDVYSSQWLDIFYSAALGSYIGGTWDAFFSRLKREATEAGDIKGIQRANRFSQLKYFIYEIILVPIYMGHFKIAAFTLGTMGLIKAIDTKNYSARLLRWTWQKTSPHFVARFNDWSQSAWIRPFKQRIQIYLKEKRKVIQSYSVHERAHWLEKTRFNTMKYVLCSSFISWLIPD
jgi:hypothetical protein